MNAQPVQDLLQTGQPQAPAASGFNFMQQPTNVQAPIAQDQAAFQIPAYT